jgi:hypothetical protein
MAAHCGKSVAGLERSAEAAGAGWSWGQHSHLTKAQDRRARGVDCAQRGCLRFFLYSIELVVSDNSPGHNPPLCQQITRCQTTRMGKIHLGTLWYVT